MTKRKFNKGDKFVFQHTSDKNNLWNGKIGVVVALAGNKYKVSINGCDEALASEKFMTLLHSIAVGDRVVYVGTLTAQLDKVGRVSEILPSGIHAVVHFDYDGRGRVMEIKNLRPEKEIPMTNFKTTVANAITKLFEVLTGDSEKEQAVRRLGIAQQIASVGDKEKKTAKAALVKLGIITGDVQNGVVFDSQRYVMTAATKAASSRIEAGALTAALANEGLSQAMMRRIIAAATVESKAATSFTVETK